MAARNESDGDSSRQRFLLYVGIGAAVVIILAGVPYMYDSLQTPFYSATITAVSGLDPDTDLPPPAAAAAGTLSPAFNLTVGVASRSRLEGARIGAGTSVKVSYSHLGLPMATGHVPEMHVGPRESMAAPCVVASGRDVTVPGFLMDSLAEEMRTGEAMFEVELMESREYGWHHVATGWGKVGDTISLNA